MRTTVTLVANGLEDPFVANPALGGSGINGGRTLFNRFRALLKAVMAGGLANRAAAPKLYYSTNNAFGLVTCAAVQAADTVTVNGQALTATQHRATGTITCATAIAGNTVVLNGHTFTGVEGAAGANQFSVDTGNDETAASLAAAIVAACALPTNPLLYGIVGGAKSASAVCTIFAYSPGTGGDAITLTSSGATVDPSGATFANGAAAGSNEFDYVGTNAVNAGSIADALAASATALVSGAVVGSNRTAIVTCSNVSALDSVTVFGQKLQAGVTATDSGGARITTMPPNLWCMNSTDTNDAVSLVNCINAHPVLRGLCFASNASGVVTIRERNPGMGNQAVVTSSNGTRLAVTNVSTTGLMQPSATCFIQSLHAGAGGNQATLASSDGTRLAVSGARLTGGASTAVTF